MICLVLRWLGYFVVFIVVYSCGVFAVLIVGFVDVVVSGSWLLAILAYWFGLFCLVWGGLGAFVACYLKVRLVGWGWQFVVCWSVWF